MLARRVPGSGDFPVAEPQQRAERRTNKGRGFTAQDDRRSPLHRACRAVLDNHTFDPTPTLDYLWEVDAWARREVESWRS